MISGDVLTDIDLGALIAEHREREALATIGLVRVENPLEYGIVIANEDGSIERFLEKPTWGQVFSDTINSGIYVLEPRDLRLDRARPAGRLLERRLPGAARGRRGRARLGRRGLLGGRRHAVRLRAGAQGHPRRPGRRCRSPASSWPTASTSARAPRSTPTRTLTGPCVIGDNCFVDAGVRLGEYVVLGTGVRMRRDGELERTVVHENAYIGESVKMRGAVVGRASDLRRGVRCEEGVVLGDEVFVGENAVLSSDVKVYPFKTVEAGAVVNTSVIWESRGAR